MGVKVWLSFCILLVGCANPARPTAELPAEAPAAPIGAGECARCHQAEANQWRSSHHAMAMQPARTETVLGDFGGVQVGGRRFSQRDGRFFLGELPVAYTFGVYPLQQYLVQLAGGKLQVFDWAWDARPQKEGGQRWFQPPSGRAFDWRGPYHNWNFMCADCHSTGVHKNYDPARGTYATTSLETAVSCEACHGPGSNHRDWAQRGAKAADHGWSRPPAPWLETCARCHSRRSALNQAPDGLDFHDAYEPETLEAPNYQVDGQVLEEDFELGAFRQSKMHAKGVTCLDCHQAHTLGLKAEGNALCLRCHDNERFSPRQHTHHLANSPGSNCVSCHMPRHTYMGVDVRHDHSLRVPRPDLTRSLGVDNACNSCHRDRSAEWAERAVQEWFGPKRVGFQRHARAFAAARRQESGAEGLLQALARQPEAPAIVRATALAELRRYLSQRSLPAVEEGLRDTDPGVRIQALRALEGLPMEERWARGQLLLQDPRLAVRLRAASVLGSFPPEQLGRERQQALDPALQEFWRWGEALSDRPEAHLEVAGLHMQRGELAEAEKGYGKALQLAPGLPQAVINLADLYRVQGQEKRAEALLRQALSRSPREADLHHALGLSLVRQGKAPQALLALERAVQLEPQDLDFGYVLIVAWSEAGRTAEALKLARRYLVHYPEQEQLLTVSAELARRCEREAEAQRRHP